MKLPKKQGLLENWKKQPLRFHNVSANDPLKLSNGNCQTLANWGTGYVFLDYVVYMSSQINIPF